MKKIHWRIILRDVAIIWGLTILGGFVVGFVATTDDGQYAQWLAISYLLSGTTGFFIVGCMAKINRFKHLLDVAVVTCLTSLVNVLFFEQNLAQWFFSIYGIVVMTVVGGGVSFVFVRPLPQQPE